MRSEDCAIANNALCTVRQIDRFELVGDDLGDGATTPKKVSEDPLVTTLPVVAELGGGILELYEADANDDFGLRSNGGDYPVVAPYTTPTGSATSTRALRANELNSLTKACAPATNGDASVDYNANLIPDIEEWHGMPQSSDVATWLQPFVHYSYFLELYEGYYAAGEPGQPGAYYLVEKARLPTGGVSALTVPLVTGEGDGYWQSCWRRRDVAYVEPGEGTPPTIGMDFGRFNQQTGEHGAPVLGHSSQFKCLSILPDSEDIEDPALTPHRIHISDANTHYQVNACRVDTDALPDSVSPGDPDGGNTFTPALACDTTNAVAGVTLAVDRYDDYSDTSGYVRGCINECVDHAYLSVPEQCDDWQQPTFSCSADDTTGKLTKCSYNAGCADCTWDGSQWNCAPRSADVCGNCGTCTEKENDPPSWTCDKIATNCNGDCSECYEQPAGVFQCRAKPNNPCGSQCGVCEGSGTHFACQYYESMCGTDGCSGFSGCNYSGVCDEAAQQERTCKDYTCTKGMCSLNERTETQNCTRDTDGKTCGAGNAWCGNWGSCSYSSTCDESKSQRRSCYRHGCDNGVCGQLFTRSEGRECGITRDTDGDLCKTQVCSGGPDCLQKVYCSGGSCSRAGSCRCECREC
jgi:hypothetical protein